MNTPALPTETDAPGPARRRTAVAAVFLLAWGVALALAWTGGGAESGFGAYEDEPAHLVSGLLVSDYLVDGLGTDPMAFAKRYFVHYPKVAIGHWPPGFPLLVGTWVALFGDSHLALLTLMAGLAGAVSALLFAVLRAPLGGRTALAAALVFVCVPRVQAMTFSVMTELPLALFCTLAVVGFGRWLDEPRRRHLALFTVAAVAAVYVKGSALFLALLPPLAIAVTGRWRRWRRPDLWIAALVVGGLCAPWYLYTWNVAHTTWGGGGGPTWGYVRRALPVYGVGLVELTGFVGLALAVFGAADRARDAERPGFWAALVAWPACHLVGLLLVPTGEEPRHLVGLAPAWVALWAAGVASLRPLARGAASGAARGGPVFLALAVAAFLASADRPIKDDRGYEVVAEEILADPTLANSVLLIASDSIGEGLFVGDVALREERPGHVVLRASKFLGASDWLGRVYWPRFQSVEALGEALEELPVGVVVLDRATVPHHWFRHHDQLAALFAARPEVWEHVGNYDVRRGGVLHAGALEVYRQVGHEARTPRAIDFDALVGRDLPSF